MSLILSRYECAECPRRHANGSAAQARCEEQRKAVNASHGPRPCARCKLWPAWADSRCDGCGTSPKERASWARWNLSPDNLGGGA